MPFAGHRYGKCPLSVTHCPHTSGDDDEWCCQCVQSVVLDRDLEAYAKAGYPPFDENLLPAPLDGSLVESGLADDNSENTRAKGRGTILVESATMLRAWLDEIESRQMV